MPSVKQSKMTESPQMVKRQIGTKIVGGNAPSDSDVIKSANARGGKRHDVKGEQIADINVIADSSHMEGNEMVGIKNHGYLVKKDTPYGVNAHFNSLPPGMDIEDQEVCDIRKMPMKTVTAMGFPGDGWTEGEDVGRPATTNYNGGSST